MITKIPKRSKIVQEIYSLIVGLDVQFSYKINYNLKENQNKTNEEIADKIGNKPLLLKTKSIDKFLKNKGIEVKYIYSYDFLNGEIIYTFAIDYISFDNKEFVKFTKDIKSNVYEIMLRINVNYYKYTQRVKKDNVYDNVIDFMAHKEITESINEDKQKTYEIEDVKRITRKDIKDNFFENGDYLYIYRFIF